MFARHHYVRTGDRSTDVTDGPHAHDREPLLRFLVRGTDPRGIADRDALARALSEVRAGLDGVFALSGSASLRFSGGEPVELGGPCWCADPGLGGHHCRYGCAGGITYEYALPEAEAAAGCRLAFAGPWTDGRDGESFAPVRRASP